MTIISCGTHPSVRARQMVEEAIARRVVTDAIAAGYSLAVDNGEETGEKSNIIEVIMRELGTTDEDTISFYKNSKQREGFVYLVYGNSGHDVMANWSVAIEPVLEGARKLADELENPAEYFGGVIAELTEALKAYEKAIGAGFDCDPALWADAALKSRAALEKAGA